MSGRKLSGFNGDDAAIEDFHAAPPTHAAAASRPSALQSSDPEKPT
jgi:hypothetical protein